MTTTKWFMCDDCGHIFSYYGLGCSRCPECRGRELSAVRQCPVCDEFKIAEWMAYDLCPDCRIKTIDEFTAFMKGSMTEEQRKYLKEMDMINYES